MSALTSGALAACDILTADEVRSPPVTDAGEAAESGGFADEAGSEAGEDAQPSAPEAGLPPVDAGGPEPAPPDAATSATPWCGSAEAGVYRLCRDFDVAPTNDGGPFQAWEPALTGQGALHWSPPNGFEGTIGLVAKIQAQGSALFTKALSISGNETIVLRYTLLRTSKCTSVQNLGGVQWGNNNYYLQLNVDSSGRYFASACDQTAASCFPSTNYLSANTAAEWSEARLEIKPASVKATVTQRGVSQSAQWDNEPNLGNDLFVWVGVRNGVNGCEWVFDNVTVSY